MSSNGGLRLRLTRPAGAGSFSAAFRLIRLGAGSQ
jgi:hypothetical protein